MFPSVCQGLELEQKDGIRHAWPCRLSLYLCLHNQLQGHASSITHALHYQLIGSSHIASLFSLSSLSLFSPSTWCPRRRFLATNLPGLSQTLFAQTNGTSAGLLVHLSELGAPGKYRNGTLSICTHLPRSTLRFIFCCDACCCTMVLSPMFLHFSCTCYNGILSFTLTFINLADTFIILCCRPWNSNWFTVEIEVNKKIKNKTKLLTSQLNWRFFALVWTKTADWIIENAHSFSTSRRCFWNVINIAFSPVTLTKQRSAHKLYFIRSNENPIETFLKTIGSL